MKAYKCKDGFTRQYEEGKQPEGAVEVKAEVKKTEEKKTEPKNKAKAVKNK